MKLVLYMHQFAFFSLSPLLSFGISLQLQLLVQVLHRDTSQVVSSYKPLVPPLYSAENKHGCRCTSPVQDPPRVSSRATNRAVTYSDREFSPLGAISRMVSGRTILPFLYPTYCHTPPQHRSSPLLKARCCLATLSKALVVQLAQCIDTRRK